MNKKKENGKVRDKDLIVRVSKQEQNEFENAATDAGLTKSAWVRMVLLAKARGKDKK